MSRILPHPILSAFLLLLWLLLQQSVSTGNILLGAAIGIVAGYAMSALQPERLRLNKWWLIPRFAGLVLYDIVRSNIAVASIVLQNERLPRSAGFITIPLEIRHRMGLAILAIIITSTPGTVWLEFDEREGTLLIHILDLVDEETWIEIIKGRYERMLLEIFRQ